MIKLQRLDQFVPITIDGKISATDFAQIVNQMMDYIEAQQTIIEDHEARLQALEP